jgi:hypothetical protein
VLIISCSSTNLVDRWKNPDIDSYQPSKVLVIGLTSNKAARLQFESMFKKELELRGSEAETSNYPLDSITKNEKLTDQDLNTLETQLLLDGFDTILLTKIVGVEEQITYRENYDGYDETYRRFKEEYLMYQDAHYNPDYYKAYTIYKAETSMYCICPTKDRELIWKGHINITDPQSQSIEKTIDDYIRLVLVALEEEQLINPIMIIEEKSSELIE